MSDLFRRCASWCAHEAGCHAHDGLLGRLGKELSAGLAGPNGLRVTTADSSRIILKVSVRRLVQGDCARGDYGWVVAAVDM